MNEVLEKVKKRVEKTSLYNMTPSERIKQLEKMLDERQESKIQYRYKIEEFNRLRGEIYE